MQISDFLQIRPGITAVIGSGGKTTLLHTLCEELPGRIILCTTTHIYPPANIPVYDPDAEMLVGLVASNRVICCGIPCENGKLTVPTLTPFELSIASDYVLVEADGSKMLPMKAHASYEPVIPGHTDNIILVVGASCFGKPIREVCHRPALFSELSDCEPDDIVTPERAAAVILKENLTGRIFVNQAELPGAMEASAELAGHLGFPVIAGSLKEGWYKCLF